MITNLFSLKNKVIVVTGGTGLLGTAFVNAIANANATVVIIARNENNCKQMADTINCNEGHAMGIGADVMNEKQLLLARDIIIKKFGTIDGLVNAAGGNIPEAIIPADADIFNLSIEQIKKVVDLNCIGTILPTQIFGGVMAKNGSGSIVNISSISTKTVLTKVLGYSIAKAAVDMYTKWMAVEVANRYGDGIRINTIVPGFFLAEQNKALLINTDNTLTQRGNSIITHTPFKRFGNATELQGALIYLLSDASKFVTGSEIIVDGGFSKFSGV